MLWSLLDNKSFKFNSDSSMFLLKEVAKSSYLFLELN